jgi:hypothetical protein
MMMHHIEKQEQQTIDEHQRTPEGRHPYNHLTG